MRFGFARSQSKKKRQPVGNCSELVRTKLWRAPPPRVRLASLTVVTRALDVLLLAAAAPPPTSQPEQSEGDATFSTPENVDTLVLWFNNKIRYTSSDENSVLNYPHKFTPSQLSRLACGWFNPSAARSAAGRMLSWQRGAACSTPPALWLEEWPERPSRWQKTSTRAQPAGPRRHHRELF